MGKILALYSRPTAPGAQVIYIGTASGAVWSWPGGGGTDPTTTDFVTGVGVSGAKTGPLTYFPGDGLIYSFSGGKTDGLVTIKSLDPTTLVVSTVLSFSVWLGGFRLGEDPIVPSPPFVHSFLGEVGDGTNIPIVVTEAAVIGDAIYLIVRDTIAAKQDGLGVCALFRFLPGSGTITLVHGPFQNGQYRDWLGPLFGTYLNATHDPNYVYAIAGFTGDVNARGFVAQVGGSLYWSPGALLFASGSGDLGTWTLADDGISETRLITNQKVYSLYQPGAYDGSGSFVFGAAGEKTVIANVNPSGSVTQQNEPYSAFDATNASVDTSTYQNYVPIAGVDTDVHFPVTPGGADVPLLGVAGGNNSIQPVTRALMTVSGGMASVVSEDTDEDASNGRMILGPVHSIYAASGAILGLMAIVRQNQPGSTAPQNTRFYVNVGGGWTTDPSVSTPFLGDDGAAGGRYVFSVQGQIYALSLVFVSGGFRYRLLQRTGAGAWTTITDNVGITFGFPMAVHDFSMTNLSFVNPTIGKAL